MNFPGKWIRINCLIKIASEKTNSDEWATWEILEKLDERARNFKMAVGDFSGEAVAVALGRGRPRESVSAADLERFSRPMLDSLCFNVIALHGQLGMKTRPRGAQLEHVG